MATIEIIGVPTSAASFAPGQEKAPQALRRAGLVPRLEAAGHEVVDRGDPPIWRWRPDLKNRSAQNLEPTAHYIENARDRIELALKQGHFPLVLGGNCTVAMAAVAAVANGSKRVGLIYLDRHADLNVPVGVGTTREGALDWMGVAHMLGIEGTLPRLSQIGPRFPLLGCADIFYLGIEPEQMSPWETDWLGRLRIHHRTAVQVAVDPESTGRAVLQEWARDYNRIVIHFDVDVIDFVDLPLSEAYHFRNSGLTYRQTLAVLKVLLSDERIAALSIGELNPDHGEEDGTTVRIFVDGLASLFLERK